MKLSSKLELIKSRNHLAKEIPSSKTIQNDYNILYSKKRSTYNINLKKINFEKWKNNYLIMKIKEKLIQNVKENNKINIIYQNGENFMIKGNEKEKKIESKNEVKNIEQIQKKSKIINQELEVQENINSITIISKREIKDKKEKNQENKDKN